MSNIIVFEGRGEVIVGDPHKIGDLIQDWFIDGQRNLDDYESYMIDGAKGAGFSYRVHSQCTPLDIGSKDFDILTLLPDHLRDDLIERGILPDEG